MTPTAQLHVSVVMSCMMVLYCVSASLGFVISNIGVVQIDAPVDPDIPLVEKSSTNSSLDVYKFVNVHNEGLKAESTVAKEAAEVPTDTTTPFQNVPGFITSAVPARSTNRVENIRTVHDVATNSGENPPTFAEPLPDWPDRDYYDDSGPPITLNCRLVANVSASVYWYKDGLLLHQKSGIYEFSANNQVLSLVLPRQDQTGEYLCLTNNTYGSVNHTGYILITARRGETRPRVTQTDPPDLVSHAVIGSSVNISCVFDVGGSQTALMGLSVNWLLEGVTVNDTDHTTWGLETTRSNNQVVSLYIHSLQDEDYGSYTCLGQNSIGNDSKVIRLERPLPDNNHTQLPVIIGVTVAGVLTLTFLTVSALLCQHWRLRRKYKELEWPEPDMKGFKVPDEPPQYDVFISYSSEDLGWVKDELFTYLEDRKYTVCIDFKDFVPGMPVCENIIESIYKSRKTIVVWSANFRRSLWGEFELQQAHHRNIIQRKDSLVLLRYDDSRVPAKLLGQTFLDWSDVQVRPHFWARLLESLGEPAIGRERDMAPDDVGKEREVTLDELEKPTGREYTLDDFGKLTEGELDPYDSREITNDTKWKESDIHSDDLVSFENNTNDVNEDCEDSGCVSMEHDENSNQSLGSVVQNNLNNINRNFEDLDEITMPGIKDSEGLV